MIEARRSEDTRTHQDSTGRCGPSRGAYRLSRTPPGALRVCGAGLDDGRLRLSVDGWNIPSGSRFRMIRKPSRRAFVGAMAVWSSCTEVDAQPDVVLGVLRDPLACRRWA